MQHGLVDYTDAVPMLQAISQTDATPMVRVPWNMPDIIMKSLDAGAYGIVCPMINTPAEVRGVHPELPLRPARPPLVRPDPRRAVWRAPITGSTPTRRSSRWR